MLQMLFSWGGESFIESHKIFPALKLKKLMQKVNSLSPVLLTRKHSASGRKGELTNTSSRFFCLFGFVYLFVFYLFWRVRTAGSRRDSGIPEPGLHLKHTLRVGYLSKFKLHLTQDCQLQDFPETPEIVLLVKSVFKTLCVSSGGHGCATALTWMEVKEQAWMLVPVSHVACGRTSLVGCSEWQGTIGSLPQKP